MVNPDAPSPSAARPEGPKDTGAGPATTVERKHRKRGKRSANKARRGSDDKDATTGRTTTTHGRRHKRKGAAGRDENEDKTGEVAPVDAENETARQREVSAPGLKPPEVPEGAADAGKQDTAQEGPPVVSALHADSDAEGGAKETTGNANADAAGAKSPPAAEDANIPQEAGAEDQLNDLLSENALERRKGHRMQLKRASCVSFQSPEEYHVEAENDAAEGSPSPTRRPSRSRFRMSEGEMRSLYSVVALKDLASTARTRGRCETRGPI
ncbi:hypothetical protein V5799_013843 [Amblyomma americanum]|uniref:Uncharacterized protein n=1 Tax=Amblyomma americanum TaxID=6943 RepID=A0AAQ4E4R0_AMBAM